MKVKLTDIERNPQLQRHLDEDAVARYQELYEEGKGKPLTVQKGTLVLIDGYHRLEAAKRAGLEEIEVEEIDVPDDLSSQLVAAYRANRDHGVPSDRSQSSWLVPWEGEDKACSLVLLRFGQPSARL